jgi:glucose/arabinose dehydrogenase/cytochrome c5
MAILRILGLAALVASGALSRAAPREIARLRLEQTTLEVAILAEGLDSPFDLNWGPDGKLWVTQLEGTVWRIDPASGEKTEVLRVPEVFYRRSHGLLSFAFHPDFPAEPWVYLHYVYQLPPEGKNEVVRSRLVRSRWDGARLGAPEVVFDGIPGRSYHNGSRVVVGPDRKLYLSTGDAGTVQHAQDQTVLSGKILRLELDGRVPTDNPFPGSPVWTVGHRNVQGLAFGRDGKLYASDHGANNDDEINLIAPGQNYGWPDVEGFADRLGEQSYAAGRAVTAPLRAWTPTIAASGLAYYDHAAIPQWEGKLLLANLKGRALRELSLAADGRSIGRERIFLQEKLGRIRDVVLSPAGDVYLLTSNGDWHPRFQPWMYSGLPAGPDKVVRLRPVADQPAPAGLARWTEDLEPLPLMTENWNFAPAPDHLRRGQELYAIHCVACHGPEGLGAPGLIPPLARTEWVTGEKNRLIQVALKGMSGRIEVNGASYDQEMPGFRHLSDDELAAILTFTRASFGNKASAVIPEEIFEERKGLR